MKRPSWTWKDARLPEETATKLQANFEIGLYEAITQVEPENVEVLMILGDLYSRNGQLDKGLEVDQKLVEIQPREPLYYYNLACTHSLLGHIDPAFQALFRAVQLGYNKLEQMIEDPDLANLKKDDRYEALLRELQDGSSPLHG